jgi:hypothetical protein
MSKADAAIAPKGGYDTPEKQAYRKQVWDALLPAWEMAKGDARAHILLMPSREGLEIEHVLSLGIPQDRIIAVDRSAAVIATSIWRKKYPNVKFYASEVGDVWRKINRDGFVICAANLDFCSNFCDELVCQFSSFVKNTPRFTFFRIAVTVAKGREGKALVAMLKKAAPYIREIAEPRIAALLDCSEWGNEDLLVWAQGSYISGRVPMAWAIFSDNYILQEWADSHIEMLRSIELEPIADEMIGVFGKRHLTATSILNDWLYPRLVGDAPEQLNRLESQCKKIDGLGFASHKGPIKTAASVLDYVAKNCKALFYKKCLE